MIINRSRNFVNPADVDHCSTVTGLELVWSSKKLWAAYTVWENVEDAQMNRESSSPTHTHTWMIVTRNRPTPMTMHAAPAAAAAADCDAGWRHTAVAVQAGACTTGCRSQSFDYASSMEHGGWSTWTKTTTTSARRSIRVSAYFTSTVCRCGLHSVRCALWRNGNYSYCWRAEYVGYEWKVVRFNQSQLRFYCNAFDLICILSVLLLYCSVIWFVLLRRNK